METPITAVRDFNRASPKKGGLNLPFDNWTYVFFGSMLILGIVTGFVLTGDSTTTNIKGAEEEKFIKTDKIVGSTDTKIFKDSAEGKLEKGGIDGEGTHHLVREGGPSQTAYLTSSVIDLDQFVGKEVKVWGETFQAEKAGWLMDVGRVELK